MRDGRREMTDQTEGGKRGRLQAVVGQLVVVDCQEVQGISPTGGYW